MPSTSLGTHLVKSMLVDPVIDELEMDRDEVFIHGIMCGLDSNSSYDLYDIIVHIVLAGVRTLTYNAALLIADNKIAHPLLATSVHSLRESRHLT
jgi:hypothetical protein